MSLVVVDGVGFARPGGFRLDVPRFEVAAGERVAVVGPSGSGKTTLLNLIAGILVPQTGTVDVAGERISALPDARRRAVRIARIGHVFQNFALVDYLSGLQNILYPYRITDALTLDAAARDRAAALARQTGLQDRIGRKPAALSQGEKQRVAICRALVTEPALVLADEATGNLDPANKTLILDLLFEQTRARGAALLAVTHDHALLPRFDRVVDFHAFRVPA